MKNVIMHRVWSVLDFLIFILVAGLPVYLMCKFVPNEYVMMGLVILYVVLYLKFIKKLTSLNNPITLTTTEDKKKNVLVSIAILLFVMMGTPFVSTDLTIKVLLFLVCIYLVYHNYKKYKSY